MRLLLGLDIGSTVIKAVLFDLRGRVLGHSEMPVVTTSPQEGRVERDAESVWLCARTVLRRAVATHGADIAAIGVTGCGNGAVFIDRVGRPVGSGILSGDTRAKAFVSRPHPNLGQQPYPGQLPSLLRWLRKIEPTRARRTAHALFWKDFVRARLTDVLCSDFTDAGAAGLLDYRSRAQRTTDPLIPPLRESLSPAGEITRAAAMATGLKAGTPVITGCIDCEAAAIGSGVFHPAEVSMVAGTWSINQAYVTHLPQRTNHFLVNPSVMPRRWLVLEGSPNSAGNFEWARRAFGPPNATLATAEAARSTRSRLLFIPRVPSGAGAFVGLASNHERGHLLRAVMEGVVFAHRVHLEKLTETTGPIRRVTLSGGASRSTVWSQMFANGLGCVVEVPKSEQIGALGAAICAGVGAGLWTSIPHAQEAMLPRKTLFLPRSREYATLTDDYARYREHAGFLLL